MSHELRIDDERDINVGHFTGDVPRIGEEVRTFNDDKQATRWKVSRVVWWVEPPSRDRSGNGLLQLRPSRAVVYVTAI